MSIRLTAFWFEAEIGNGQTLRIGPSVRAAQTGGTP
jgi:hypothetical protein